MARVKTKNTSQGRNGKYNLGHNGKYASKPKMKI